MLKFSLIARVPQALRRHARSVIDEISRFRLRPLRLGSLPVVLALTGPAHAGDVGLFALPIPDSYPESVAVGPGGTIWFTEKQGNRIGRLAPDGELTEYPIPTQDSRPQAIVAGPDGAL
ncbi:virginiamycin B lyase family protein, partial [Methylorubrum zatmanii]